MRRLSDLDGRVPKVLASDLDAMQPFTILERLPGTDIGNVLSAMTTGEITRAARDVAAMQLRARGLSPMRGFGYAADDDASLHLSWRLFLEAEIEQSRRLIGEAGVVSVGRVDQVSDLLENQAVLLDGVEPLAFLDDATTKNVIVDAGRVVGFVDVDHVAFGDALWAVALTRMSLLSARRPTDFAEDQVDSVSASAQRWRRMDLYAALHCLGFLAELGQRFNQEMAPPPDPDHQRHLEETLDSLLRTLR